MSITTSTGATFEATVDNAPTGLVGTITVRLEDGQDTVVTAATTSGIVESGVGIYTATLTAPDVAGQYVVIWNDGDTLEASEDVTVAGGLTATELKARFPELASYSDAAVQAAVDLATEAFEHAADVAFAPRTETLTLTASDTGRLTLPRARVTAVNSISGSSTGSVDVADGQIIAGGLFVNGSTWLTSETLTVSVTHGYATMPLEVSWAIGLLARRRLLRGNLDDRATQLAAENGGVVNLATPGLFGSEFGVPDVDAVLRRYRHHALVP
jgi:hypothetical protein